MKRVSPHAIGLVFALFLAIWHFLWAVLVWAGAAQPFLDFIFQLHMITPPYKIAPFSLGLASALVLVTAGIGYVAGLVVGVLWNRWGPRELGPRTV